MWERHLSIFAGGLFCAGALTPSVRDFALRRGWMDLPGAGRHIHSRPVPRLGGVAIYLAVVCILGIVNIFPGLAGLSAPYPWRTIAALLGSATAVFLLGLYDDLRPVSPYWKIAVQSLAAGVLYAAGFQVKATDLLSSGHALSWALRLLLTILWVLLITNAFNLIDGLDGLAAGSALFSMAVIFVAALLHGDAAVSLLTLALAGATCGFLCFNFHPATIFLGDSGSLFIGFLLAALALAGSEKAAPSVAVAIPAVAFGLPLMDVALAIGRRLLRGSHLFRGDGDHIHHRLLKRGFSHRDAVLLLYATSAGFGILSLILLDGPNRLSMVLAVLGIGVWCGVRYLRYAELSEVQGLLALLLQRRRMVANNLAVRQAAEALESSSDFDQLCKVARKTLEPLGFVGLYFQLDSKDGAPGELFAPLRDDGSGGLCYYWGDELARRPKWELRLELALREEQSLGQMSLFRASCNEPVCVDSHLLCSAFRLALSGAVERAMGNVSARARENQLVESATAHRVASA